MARRSPSGTRVSPGCLSRSSSKPWTPFVAGVHPGFSDDLGIFVPGAIFGSGLPSDGALISVEDVVLTSKTVRFERNSLATGSYTFRGVSIAGVCPVGIAEGVSIGTPAEPAGPGDFIRDIADFGFVGGSGTIVADDFCPESFEATEDSELIEDSCQGELWPSYVGITGLNVTATITGKGVGRCVRQGWYSGCLSR